MMSTGRDPNEQQEFLLSQYLDGDLDDQARRKVEARLAEDAECRAALERLRATDRLIKNWARPVPELNWHRFSEEVATRREQAVEAERWRRRIRLFVPLAAAAAVALFASLYISLVQTEGPAPGKDVVASVTVERGDAWRHSQDTGPALAQVHVVRTFSLRITGSSAAIEARGVAVAAAAIQTGFASDEEPTPYF